jgi:hypothetical protein
VKNLPTIQRLVKHFLIFLQEIIFTNNQGSPAPACSTLPPAAANLRQQATLLAYHTTMQDSCNMGVNYLTICYYKTYYFKAQYAQGPIV